MKESDDFSFGEFQPYNVFVQYINETKKWNMSEITMDTIHLMKQIEWCSGGDKYDSCS